MHDKSLLIYSELQDSLLVGDEDKHSLHRSGVSIQESTFVYTDKIGTMNESIFSSKYRTAPVFCIKKFRWILKLHMCHKINDQKDRGEDFLTSSNTFFSFFINRDKITKTQHKSTKKSYSIWTRFSFSVMLFGNHSSVLQLPGLYN